MIFDLKKERKKINITQKELALELCVSITAISLWESKNRDIPKYIVKLFCLIYCVDFSSFEYKKDSWYDSIPDLPFS